MIGYRISGRLLQQALPHSVCRYNLLFVRYNVPKKKPILPDHVERSKTHQRKVFDIFLLPNVYGTLVYVTHSLRRTRGQEYKHLSNRFAMAGIKGYLVHS